MTHIFHFQMWFREIRQPLHWQIFLRVKYGTVVCLIRIRHVRSLTQIRIGKSSDLVRSNLNVNLYFGVLVVTLLASNSFYLGQRNMFTHRFQSVLLERSAATE